MGGCGGGGNGLVKVDSQVPSKSKWSVVVQ